jgi:hypothetical protein
MSAIYPDFESFECKQAKVQLNNIKELIGWWNECVSFYFWYLDNAFAFYNYYAHRELEVTKEKAENDVKDFFKDKPNE